MDDFDSQAENDEQKTLWPRSITIRATEENAKKLLGRDVDELSGDAYDAFLFEWGYSLYEQVEINSWDDLELPPGFEIENEDERHEYKRHLNPGDLGA